ncbi:hypothetical protein THH46_12765 [Pseudomonas sp. NA13]|uniref:Uncharacterized protein n=1 Tax=Pseudomonas brassicacearum TaxID=930166 RepID=A0AAJ3G1H9_9PSED|nr:hypothetical protein [Pseudomonas brassicacearum]NUT84381.1 hypothetical protein [Pseudomonas brassicacearum]QGA49704.1 hypothetical protein GFU70_11400 [Pseudomonas brassicacearum]
MSETVSAPDSDQDPTTEVTPSAPPPLAENKEEQGTVAPVIVWRTLMLEQ